MEKNSIAQKIIAMRKQGLSDNQIIQSLQHEGHAAPDILESFDIADHAKPFENKINPKPVHNTMAQQPKSVAPPPFSAKPNPSIPNQAPPPMNNPNPQNENPIENNNSDEEIEELIEAILDEKWEELKKDVTKVVDWKDSIEEEVKSLKGQMQTLEKNFENLHKAIVGKVGDYDKNILEVGTQLKAMEKVFSQVLPAFTDNVTELSRVTEKLKKI
ncbi:MAG: hypothetical protein ACMXYK_03740 [Candidatus Woesearchaeota archaeon]